MLCTLASLYLTFTARRLVRVGNSNDVKNNGLSITY
jgi:hypothetical protein